MHRLLEPSLQFLSCGSRMLALCAYRLRETRLPASDVSDVCLPRASIRGARRAGHLATTAHKLGSSHFYLWPTKAIRAQKTRTIHTQGCLDSVIALIHLRPTTTGLSTILIPNLQPPQNVLCTNRLLPSPGPLAAPTRTNLRPGVTRSSKQPLGHSRLARPGVCRDHPNQDPADQVVVCSSITLDQRMIFKPIVQAQHRIVRTRTVAIASTTCLDHKNIHWTDLKHLSLPTMLSRVLSRVLSRIRAHRAHSHRLHRTARHHLRAVRRQIKTSLLPPLVDCRELCLSSGHPPFHEMTGNNFQPSQMSPFPKKWCLRTWPRAVQLLHLHLHHLPLSHRPRPILTLLHPAPRLLGLGHRLKCA